MVSKLKSLKKMSQRGKKTSKTSKGDRKIRFKNKERKRKGAKDESGGGK